MKASKFTEAQKAFILKQVTLPTAVLARSEPHRQAFSKLKAHLRRIGARTFTEVFNAIGEICELYQPTECWNYFKAAGYASG